MKANREQEKPRMKSPPSVTVEERSSGGTAAFIDQRNSETVQRKLIVGMGNATPRSKVSQLQSAMQSASGRSGVPIQRKANNTGLPNNLKSGIENLSGFAMDDVKVHYNSAKPAQLQAHAFAQGSDIHLAPGQEKHLPHEAWHVVQQKQGRVQPTRQLKSKMGINDDAGLEHEADVMGAKATKVDESKTTSSLSSANASSSSTIQRYKKLRKKEYQIEREDGATFSVTQADGYRYKRQKEYEKKDPGAQQGETVTQEPQKKKGIFNRFRRNKENYFSIPTRIPTEKEYLDKPEYRVNRRLKEIESRKDAEMMVSDDETMAVNHASEAKDFYATDEVFNYGNKSLEEVGSDVKLIQIPDAKIKIRSSGKMLTKVIPKMVKDKTSLDAFHSKKKPGGDRVNDKDVIVSLNESICIDFACTVMGVPLNRMNTVFLNGNQTVDIKSNPYLGDQKKLNAIRKRLGIEGAEKLGVNQFATPDVGEGFATFSVLNVNNNAQPSRWGYHFAAVVAKSEAEGDYITLENYNRKPDRESVLAKIVRDIQKKNEDALQGFQFKGDIEKLRTVDKYVQLKQYLLGVNGNTAEAMFSMIHSSIDMGKDWYFSMYGSQNKQDFHSYQDSTDHFVNPMTFRTGKKQNGE